MKKTLAIILIIFTLSLFPSLAQDDDGEIDTPVYETVQDEDQSSVEIIIDEELPIVPLEIHIEINVMGAFCGHSC